MTRSALRVSKNRGNRAADLERRRRIGSANDPIAPGHQAMRDCQGFGKTAKVLKSGNAEGTNRLEEATIVRGRGASGIYAAMTRAPMLHQAKVWVSCFASYSLHCIRSAAEP